MTDPATPATTEDLAHLDTLMSQGYVVIDNLFPREAIDELAQDLEPWFTHTPRCQGHFYGWHTTRFGSVLSKSAVAQELVRHPTILSLAGHVLGPHCDWFQLNLTQGVRIHPGAPAQPPHRDQDMWPCRIPGELLINVMWALDDFTEDNGATRLWPRSHISGVDMLSGDPGPSIAGEMKRGSVLIFLGSLLHAGGANCAQTHRTGFLLSYSLGWLKPYENQFLAYPRETVRKFPKEIQDLLGYRIHRPNLGGYENQCPSVLLREETPGPLPAVDALPDALEALAEQYTAMQTGET